MFLKVGPCFALCFTVVAFHLESTLPHFCETLNPARLCLVGRSPLRPSLLCGNFRSVFAQFVSRLRALHMCLLDLSHLPVVRACPLSEVLSISLIAICDCSTLSQFVRVDCRMSLLIRQSCFRLVQPSRRCGVSAFGSLVRFAHRFFCSLINFSSEAAAAAAACLPPGRVCLGCGLARVPALLNFLLKKR